MVPPAGPHGRGMDPPAGLEGQRTKSSKGVPQIVLVNEAISVLVHDGEGLWKGGGWLVSSGKIGGQEPKRLGQGVREVGFWDFQGTLKDIKSRVKDLKQSDSSSKC